MMNDGSAGALRTKSSGAAIRFLGDSLASIAFLYIGLLLGSVLGTFLFKMYVLGFFKGAQDYATNFAPWNILAFIMHVVTLLPAILLIWLAGLAERQSVRNGKTPRDDDRRFKVPAILCATTAGLLFVMAIAILVVERVPDPERYAVYACNSVECLDHQSGYDWAFSQVLYGPEECAVERSRSYREGCRYALRRQDHLLEVGG